MFCFKEFSNILCGSLFFQEYNCFNIQILVLEWLVVKYPLLVVFTLSVHINKLFSCLHSLSWAKFSVLDLEFLELLLWILSFRYFFNCLRNLGKLLVVMLLILVWIKQSDYLFSETNHVFLNYSFTVCFYCFSILGQVSWGRWGEYAYRWCCFCLLAMGSSG